MVIKSASLHSN